MARRNKRSRLGRVLAVAALLAAGSVLSAAPVAAQQGESSIPPVVVRITSADVAGTYTVGWRTLGGCDPGPGTSGMSGKLTLRVAAAGQADDTPTPGELRGTPVATSVVIRPVCVYTWSVSFVEATTDANCMVGPSPFAPDARNEIEITLGDPQAYCAQHSRIVVRLHPAEPVGIDDTDHNAILLAKFVATAKAVKDAPKGCRTGTGKSKVDDNDTPADSADDTVSIELRVVDITVNDEECRYDVTLTVPSQLEAVHGDRDHDVFENVDPLATIDFRIRVAVRTIYLVQRVVGDAGHAFVRYGMSTSCGDPNPIPENLAPRTAGAGVRLIEPVHRVELRAGRFNITAALTADPSAPGAFDGIPKRALDRRGGVCLTTVTLSDLPDRCAVDATSQTVNLVTSSERAIVEFEITCGDDSGTT